MENKRISFDDVRIAQWLLYKIQIVNSRILVIAKIAIIG